MNRMVSVEITFGVAIRANKLKQTKSVCPLLLILLVKECECFITTVLDYYVNLFFGLVGFPLSAHLIDNFLREKKNSLLPTHASD